MKELENKLQFLVTISLFIPVVVQSLFGKEIETANHNILEWGIVVCVLILNYLLVNLQKEELSKISTKRLEGLVTLNMFLYVLFILITAYWPAQIPFVPKVVFIVSLYGIMLLPVLFLVSLIIHFFWKRN
jgi:hypothetical protein